MSEETTKTWYLSQARRLGGLEFTPQTPEAWAEIAKTLRSRSKSREHAERIIGKFLEAGAPTRCPTPGDVAVMARNTPENPEHDHPELPEPCDECRPFAGLYRIVENERGSGAGRCLCARGAKLAALDAARTGAATPPKRSPFMTPAKDVDFRGRAAGERD